MEAAKIIAIILDTIVSIAWLINGNVQMAIFFLMLIILLVASEMY